MALDKIDTSYWLLDNKEWVANREAEWPKIEFMLKNYKPLKKNMNPIKDYFLKGKMPNWNAYKDWDDSSRHLDLFVFLWLHPSSGYDVLTNLCSEYLASDLIVYEDVKSGFNAFLDSQIIMACSHYQPYETIDDVSWPFLSGKGELLFSVMMGEDYDAEFELPGNSSCKKEITFSLPKDTLSTICNMGHWLDIERMLPINNDMLLQYDQPLEWWYESVKDVDYFNLKKRYRRQIPSFERALYQIFHFDTEKEGDTCRTRFVYKIRKILDEREFIPEFKQMWEDVKAGKIEVKDPWTR